MDSLPTITFQSDDGVALRLPDALGVAAGEPMLVERHGTVLTVRRADMAAHPRPSNADMVARLRALGPRTDGIEDRDPDIFPDRAGL